MPKDNCGRAADWKTGDMDNGIERLAAWKQQAQEFTRALRTGDDPFMMRVREIVAERRLDTQKIACVSATTCLTIIAA